MLLNLFTIALASAPFKLVAADSLQAAQRIIGSAQPLCAVITDYTLQDGTGEAVIRLARDHWPHVAGVFITGHGPGIGPDKGVHVLQKPFELGELREAVIDACLRGCSPIRVGCSTAQVHVSSVPRPRRCAVVANKHVHHRLHADDLSASPHL